MAAALAVCPSLSSKLNVCPRTSRITPCSLHACQSAFISRPSLKSSFLGLTLSCRTSPFLEATPSSLRQIPAASAIEAALSPSKGVNSIPVKGFSVRKYKPMRLAPSVLERLGGGDEGSRADSMVCQSRRKSAEKRVGKPDPVYRNRLVNLVVNRIMKNGKKSLAYGILYRALKGIKNKTQKNPLLVLRQAVRRATPKVAVKARRVGGSTYQVPIEVKSTQGRALAIRWLLAAARKRPGRTMALKLSLELLDAARDTGNAIKKREEAHRMAEANRAFASFAR